jgi:hypothetical protein
MTAMSKTLMMMTTTMLKPGGSIHYSLMIMTEFFAISPCESKLVSYSSSWIAFP